jgi:Secretion system C-terminal sorting domain
MKNFTKIFFTTFFICLLSMTSLQVTASSGRATSPSKTALRAQPTPSKMTVRMFQAAQAVEIILDIDKADPTARIVVTNIIGKQVKSERIELQPGENVLRLDVPELTQGTYIIQIVGSNFSSEARKFVKANP